MRILVFQHVAVEHPGVFREFWTEAGHEWVAIKLDEGEAIPSLDGFDAMVVMGGPMDVWEEDQHPWLVAEKSAIRDWVVGRERPFLGVCLGHQLLAEALGGAVTLMRRPEVGLGRVDLTLKGRSEQILAGLGPSIETFQWHGAEISSVPDGADVLAANAACPVQAIRYGRHAFGFQFHCEITATTVEDWKRIPAYRTSLEAALGSEEAGRLDEIVVPKLPRFRQAAQRLNANFMSLID